MTPTADREPPATEPMLGGWALDFSVVNSVPGGFGLVVDAESDFGLTLSLGGGHMPAAYLGLVTDMVQGFGALEQMGRRLVNELHRHGAWYVALGVGGLVDDVLEFKANYVFMTLSADASVDAVREAMSGNRLPPVAETAIPGYVQMHALQARVGGRALLGPLVVLRFGLGWIQRIGGSFGAVLPTPFEEDPRGRVTRLYDNVRRNIADYGFTPELYVQLGVRLR